MDPEPAAARHTRSALVLAFIAGCLASAPAAAAGVTVSDGDSFEMAGERYRLRDIDAPELHQQCTDENGRRWACGRHARSELRRLIGRNEVVCVPESRDRFGRLIATCNAAGRDLGEAMVRAGLAVAYRARGFESRYADVENEARRYKRGLWSGSFTQPRAWRTQHPRGDAAPAHENALVRGVRDWLRRTGETARSTIRRWSAALWARPPDAGERLRPAHRP